MRDDDMILLQTAGFCGDSSGSPIERNAMLAYRAEDASLTPETGFPLRLIDFGLYKYKCVKALREIIVTRENRLGYWEAYAGYDLDGTVQPKNTMPSIYNAKSGLAAPAKCGMKTYELD